MVNYVNQRNFALLGKAEATPGVAVTLAAASDAIRTAGRPVFTPNYIEIKNETIHQQFGENASKFIDGAMTLEVPFYIQKGGALGVIPDWAVLVEVGNHNVVSTANTRVKIDPVSGVGSARKTGTFAWYEDGQRFDFVGAVASAFKIDAATDSYLKGSVTLMAPNKDGVIAPLPAGLAYQAEAPVVVTPLDVITENGTAIVVSNFTFDSSITAEQRRNIGDASVHVTDRPAPMITFAKNSAGTLDDYNHLKAATNLAVKGVFGSAGNRITLDMPTGQLVSLKPTVNGNFIGRECGIAGRGKDSAYSITLD